MATLGVVSYANVSSHNKLQILQQSTNNNPLVNNNNNNNERREIIILRKKPKIPIVSEVKQQQPQPIAPIVTTVTTAPTTVLINNNNNNNGRARKRPPGGSGMLSRPQHQPPPIAVARRNARERNRVKQVNNGFATLRQHIPLSISSAYTSQSDANAGRNGSKKLSKVETLRMAVDYIRSLQQLLEESDGNNTSNSSIESATSYSPSTQTNSQLQHHTHSAYEDDNERDSPTILLDDDDDSSLIDPTSPTQVTHYGTAIGGNNLTQLMSSPDSHKTFSTTSSSHLYEVDENMAPVIVSPHSAARSLTAEMISSVHHLVPGVDMYQQTSPAEMTLLHDPVSRLQQPATTSLSPGVYSEQSVSPGATQGATTMEDLATSTFLPAFTTALKSEPLTHLIPTSLASLVHHSSHVLQFPIIKREEVHSDITGASEVIDMISWWDHEQKMRQQTTHS